jgi:hypothetical protein
MGRTSRAGEVKHVVEARISFKEFFDRFEGDDLSPDPLKVPGRGGIPDRADYLESRGEQELDHVAADKTRSSSDQKTHRNTPIVLVLAAPEPGYHP